MQALNFLACGAGVIICQRVPSNLITNIMAAIFDFNDSGRLGRVKIYTEGAVDGQE